MRPSARVGEPRRANVVSPIDVAASGFARAHTHKQTGSCSVLNKPRYVWTLQKILSAEPRPVARDARRGYALDAGAPLKTCPGRLPDQDLIPLGELGTNGHVPPQCRRARVLRCFSASDELPCSCRMKNEGSAKISPASHMLRSVDP